MKKATSFFLLILFLFNIMGYYFVFELSKHLARIEMDATLRSNTGRLIVISIMNVESDKDFKRIHSHEFVYKGAMYDIVRESKSGYQTIFLCKHDVRESNLHNSFNQLAGKKIQVFLWNLLSSVYTVSEQTSGVPPVIGTLVFPILDMGLISPERQTWSPPPEWA